jgi:hypothetical protein
MKDIIKDCSVSEAQKDANKLWHEYCKAARTSKQPIYKDLKNIYNQVRQGKKVIDINKVIAKAGCIEPAKPRLAIAQVGATKVFCDCNISGGVYYRDNKMALSNMRFSLNSARDVILPDGTMPTFAWEDKNVWRKMNLTAPVPLVPPQYMPKIVKPTHYILWEVDEWKMVPPTDPYLLERITRNIFVVLVGWDLTEIEKMAMAGRMI